MDRRRAWLVTALALLLVGGGLVVGVGFSPAARTADEPASRLLVGDHSAYRVHESWPGKQRNGTLTIDVVGVELVRGNDTGLHVGIRSDWLLTWDGDSASANLTVWLDAPTRRVLAVAERLTYSAVVDPQPQFAILFATEHELTSRDFRFQAEPGFCLLHPGPGCLAGPFWNHAATDLPSAPHATALAATNETGRVHLARTAFAAGDRQPPDQDFVADRDAAPGMSYAPLRPWGLEEVGADMDFPPSEAYQAAIANQSATWLQDWLRANPTHIAVSASATGVGFELQREWRILTMRLLSPNGFIGLQVVRSNVWTWPVTTPRPLGDPAVTYDVRPLDTPPELAASLPSWDELPAAGPTWASAQARWHDVAIAPMADAPLSAPSFRWSCARVCGQENLVLRAGGSAYYQLAPGQSGSLNFGTGSRWSYAVMDGVGNLSILDEGVESTNSRQLVDGLPVGADPATVSPEPQPVWSWPSPNIVAGAGALGLLAGLAFLAWLKAAPLASAFSRIAVPDLALHPTRARILEAVRAQPGIHFQALVRELGLSNGSTVHHVRKLVAAGLLAEQRRPGSSCFFLPSEPMDMRAAASVLRSESARRVLQAIVANPGQTLRELGRNVGLAPAATHHHVERLAQSGLIEKRRQASHLSLQATSLGEQAAGAAA